MWINRKKLAAFYKNSAANYDINLKENKILDQKVVEAILEEKKKITSYFVKQLKSHNREIHIVITNQTAVESISVFSYKNDIFIFVSAALLAKPIDYPDTDPSYWEWLVNHECTHIKGNHLPWIYWSNRLFTISNLALILNLILPFSIFYNLIFWLFSFTTQLLIRLGTEMHADYTATKLICNSKTLESALLAIERMTNQAYLSNKYHYVLSSIFVDPHPPLILRKWLIKKRISYLSQTSS